MWFVAPKKMKGIFEILDVDCLSNIAKRIKIYQICIKQLYSILQEKVLFHFLMS